MNATNRKKLKAALQATGRARISDEQVEEAALLLIEGGKTRAEIAGGLGVSVGTLVKRLTALADGPNGAGATAAE